MAENKPHVLAVPLPAQGHLNPLMALCRQIARHGIKVTFVNAQSVHQRLAEAANTPMEGEVDNIAFTSVTDGLKPDDDDPNDSLLLIQTLTATLPATLPDLIEKINSSNPNEKISCVIADLSSRGVLDIAQRMGIETVGFSTSSAAAYSLLLQSPKIMEEGDLDTNAANKAKWLLCNTFYELEPAACDLHPNILPVGPFHLHDTNTKKSCSDSTNLYREDASCLSWLDNKADGSVVYVSFGSFAAHSQQQLDELALGLELSGRPFLWVVRQDLAKGSRAAAYPDGFLERVREVGKIVEWAPQTRVLSHPATACFISQCGWTSVLEGMSKGVPYLCWLYYSDHAHNANYICDKWEIGLRIHCDENGMRSRYEIKNKIDMLLSGDKFKKNALKLKEMCAESVGEGGSSCKNLATLIDYLRKCGV